MSNIDDAVDAADEEVTGKSGKKKGRSKRPGFWYGVPKGTKVVTVKQKGEAINRQEAEAQLKAELGDDCTIIGPNYEIKGIKADADRATVTLSVRQIRYTRNQFEGVLDGFAFFGNGISACVVNGESFEDDELIHADIEDRVGEDSPHYNKDSSKPRVVKNAMIRRELVDEIHVS